MPARSGHVPGHAFANTNGTLRKEITNDLASKLRDISDIKRDADSIVMSDNFHLDSKMVSQQWKVEIQYRQGTKQTVAVVLVAPNAMSLRDLQDAIAGSARDGHVWEVD